MTADAIIALQSHIGTVPDGHWGPASIAACQAHLRRLMPPVNPWPKPDQASLTAYYGRPGDEAQLTPLPVVGLGILYEGQPVRVIRCHHKVAASLHAILTNLAAIEAPCLRHYAGCYNFRAMRGSTTPSLHARGAAIDLDPEHNGNHTHWPLAATMPIEVHEAFSREGWLAAGPFWHRDSMHFQATQ